MIRSCFVRVGYQCAIVAIGVTTLSAIMSTAAIADDPEDFPLFQGVRFGEVTNEFERTFFGHNRNYYDTRKTPGQLKRIFGPFPENSMYRDAEDVQRLYRETFYKQMNAGPIIRTIDLPTPFQSSLRTLPAPVVVAPVQVVEPPVFTPEPVTPIAPTAPVAPQKPVPGLW